MSTGAVAASTGILNESLTWEKLGQSERDAFKGTAKKVKLQAPFYVYKFTEYDLEKPNKAVTEWWSPLEAYDWDPGLQARLKMARTLGIKPDELTRVVAAVRTNWNALTCLLTAEIVQDVYAFWGTTGGQPKFGEETIEHMRKFDKVLEELTKSAPHRLSLPGSAGQFYIPNMANKIHIRRIVRQPVAEVIAGKVSA